MLENTNDNQLLVKITEGSHEAFAILVKKYSSYFYSIAYRFVVNRTNAEDIVQQAFLKLWEFPYKYNPDRGASFKTWFSQVIINLSIDFKRKNKHFFEDLDELQVESSDKDTAEQIYEREMKILLEKAIHRLPITQQNAINLGFYQNIPYEEVAKIMKTTTSAVKSLIMRAKENIRKYMEDQCHVGKKI